MDPAAAIRGKTGLEDYVADACEVLKFRLVRNEAEMTSDEVTFAPGMTHQIYGEQENVFGYRDLKIDLMMSAASLKAFVEVNYEDKVTDAKVKGQISSLDGIEADPVIPPLVEILAEGQVAQNVEEFKAAVKEDETFTPMGEKVHEFKVKRSENPEDESAPLVSRSFEVYKCDSSTERFKAYHGRLQPWIMFFIDAASYIDIEDERWKCFLVFEKYTVDNQNRYAVAGYLTVYEYYNYPENLRPRISQVLILPPFQRCGVGAELYRTVINSYKGRKDIRDITVEDPSEDFGRVRDYVDALHCLDLPAFGKDTCKSGFDTKMVDSARESLKMNPKQARRVYEIIRLRFTNVNDDEDYKSYRVAVKKRLFLPYQKEDKQLKKLKKVLKPQEYEAATLNYSNKEQRLDNLQSQYAEIEEQYNQVISRMNA